jgi:hypothetical protein
LIVGVSHYFKLPIRVRWSGEISVIGNKAKLRRIKFTRTKTNGGRVHYLRPDDILVVLSRLPEELWERLRAVHFNDRSWGRRIAGYVNRARREITICAFPVSVSCTPFARLKYSNSPGTFGATRGEQWPRLAVRRFFLYEVFLHELGHLQMVNANAKSIRRQFASEKLAQDFANRWRRSLWAQDFDHNDAIHYPPSLTEKQKGGPALA